MYKYRCVKCNGAQYSASENKESEPCIYCDAESVILDEKTPEGTAIPTGTNEINQFHDTTNSKRIPDYMVDHMIAIMTNLADCEKRFGLTEVYLPRKQIRIELPQFLATFAEYEVQEGYYQNVYDHLHTECSGVTFYAMRRCE